MDWQFLDGPGFLVGLLVAGTLMGGAGLLALRAYKRTLLYCAQGQTAERLIDGKFYYLVPEASYNLMNLAYIRLRHQNPALPDLKTPPEDPVFLDCVAVHTTPPVESPALQEADRLVKETAERLDQFRLDLARVLSGQPPLHQFEEVLKVQQALRLVYNQTNELDVAGNPKLRMTVMEQHAVTLLNTIKAWLDSDPSERPDFPTEVRMGIDALLMMAAMRRSGVH